MGLNGYDSGAGKAELDALDNFSGLVATRLDIKPETRLLEVGCGCGAWLRHHYLNGVNVSGTDFSHGHLRVARLMMPTGTFTTADATAYPLGVPHSILR